MKVAKEDFDKQKKAIENAGIAFVALCVCILGFKHFGLMDAVEDMLKNIAIELKAKGYDVDENVGRVSIIGAGMKSESGVASKMFKILGENSINISMISTSPIRVSCVIDSKDINAALEALHKEFIEKE